MGFLNRLFGGGKRWRRTDDLLLLLPKAIAQAQMAVPFSQSSDHVDIALSSPEDGRFRRLLQKRFQGKARFFLALPSVIASALERAEHWAKLRPLLGPMHGERESGRSRSEEHTSELQSQR